MVWSGRKGEGGRGRGEGGGSRWQWSANGSLGNLLSVYHNTHLLIKIHLVFSYTDYHYQHICQHSSLQLESIRMPSTPWIYVGALQLAFIGIFHEFLSSIHLQR